MEPLDLEYLTGDVRMRYSQYGSDPGRTCVLVHGIGMGRIVFADVAAILSAHGTVLAVDLPGFGDSPEPGTEASLTETAEVIARFVADTSTGDVTLVGHSMGTQIVTEVSVHRPELVDSLVLIAPTVNRHERSAWKQAARMIQDLTGESPKVLLLGMWEYLKTNPVWFVNKLRFMLAHQLETVTPRLRTKTLVIRGATDRVCPRDWVQEIADTIPNSEMREIDGRGHEALIRSPEPVASMILDFAFHDEALG